MQLLLPSSMAFPSGPAADGSAVNGLAGDAAIASSGTIATQLLGPSGDQNASTAFAESLRQFLLNMPGAAAAQHSAPAKPKEDDPWDLAGVQAFFLLGTDPKLPAPNQRVETGCHEASALCLPLQGAGELPAPKAMAMPVGLEARVAMAQPAKSAVGAASTCEELPALPNGHAGDSDATIKVAAAGLEGRGQLEAVVLSAPAVSSDLAPLLVEEEGRKRPAETTENAWPTSAAHLEGNGGAAVSLPAKHDLAVQQRPAISDQISNAVLARTETLHRLGRTEIHLRLEPPELGRVRVHLSAAEEHVSCRVVVQEEAARQILETQVSALRDRLSDAGITLGRFEISWEGAGRQGQQSGHEAPVATPLDPAALSRRPALVVQSVAQASPSGLVDVLA